MKNPIKYGVTLLELLVVLVIIAILSTIAVGVYSKEVLRAKFARARAEIRTLEIAIAQYEVDTGQLPPSGSGVTLAPSGIDSSGTAEGSGYLQVALRSSLNGQPFDPLSSRWLGPYIDWDYNKMGDDTGSLVTDSDFTGSQAEASFLDPFGNPYLYIKADDYALRGGTELPGTNVFAATETYFNPSGVQIMSFGPNGTTLAAPERGLEEDDITNFESF